MSRRETLFEEVCLVKEDDGWMNSRDGEGCEETGCGCRRSRAEKSSMVQHLPAHWPWVLGELESPFHLGPAEGLRKPARASEA